MSAHPRLDRIEQLLERSSLGAPSVVALRRTTSSELVARVLEKSTSASPIARGLLQDRRHMSLSTNNAGPNLEAPDPRKTRP